MKVPEEQYQFISWKLFGVIESVRYHWRPGWKWNRACRLPQWAFLIPHCLLPTLKKVLRTKWSPVTWLPQWKVLSNQIDKVHAYFNYGGNLRKFCSLILLCHVKVQYNSFRPRETSWTISGCALLDKLPMLMPGPCPLTSNELVGMAVWVCLSLYSTALSIQSLFRQRKTASLPVKGGNWVQFISPFLM